MTAMLLNERGVIAGLDGRLNEGDCDALNEFRLMFDNVLPTDGE